jgi:tetratricopeptide (TPR) repeat protein
MKKIIYTTILITLFSGLSIAQETIIWLNGGKTDAEIIKKKAQMESYGYKVFINDSAERAKRHLAKPTPSGDDKFDGIFREARELFDKEEWAKAAAKFSEIACDCPENKKVDAALYWLAYSYKKLGKVKETNAAIERLLKNYPNSTWADDARVLKYETAVANNWAIAGTISGQNIRTVTPRATTNPSEILTAAAVGENYVFPQETKLDREDEIRLAAFQSLLTNDPPKAIETLARLLQSDSKASETLKTEVIRSTQGFRWTINRGKSESEALELIKQITRFYEML